MAKKKQDVVNDVFKQKKRNLNKMIELGKDRVTERTLEAMKGCGSYLEFIATFEREKKKLVHANFCKNRYCPICAWRKARKDAMMLSIMMQAISIEKGYEYIFLTLTTPNVGSRDLSAEIDLFNKALSRMFRRKRVANSIKGYVRKLEVTYSKDRNDYNPHFHLILAVNKSYFTSRTYISHSEWLDIWRDVTGKTGVSESGTDEITQLHVQKIKGYKQEKAIQEVAKYSAKDFDMTENQDVFDTFYFALKGRQLITFNGVFKEYRKKYEQKELDHYKQKDDNSYYWLLYATWLKRYAKYEQEYVAMTADEQEFFNGDFQEEKETGEEK